MEAAESLRIMSTTPIDAEAAESLRIMSTTPIDAETAETLRMISTTPIDAETLLREVEIRRNSMAHIFEIPNKTGGNDVPNPEEDKGESRLDPTKPQGNCNFERCIAIGDEEIRTVVSHFFGRNKKETSYLPKKTMPSVCRRHYQRHTYHTKNNFTFAVKQWALVRLVFKKLRLRPAATATLWTIQAAKHLKDVNERKTQQRRYPEQDLPDLSEEIKEVSGKSISRRKADLLKAEKQHPHITQLLAGCGKDKTQLECEEFLHRVLSASEALVRSQLAEIDAATAKKAGKARAVPDCEPSTSGASMRKRSDPQYKDVVDELIHFEFLPQVDMNWIWGNAPRGREVKEDEEEQQDEEQQEPPKKKARRS